MLLTMFVLVYDVAVLWCLLLGMLNKHGLIDNRLLKQSLIIGKITKTL